jgi:putative phosphoesterase
MRIAALSDIHANIDALEAVLDDFSARPGDKIVSLGDIATLGPDFRSTLDRLESLPCEFVLGNHDYFLLHPQAIRDYTNSEFVITQVTTAAGQLTDRDRTFLSGFRMTYELTLSDGTDVIFCHATPRSTTALLLPSMPDREIEGILAGIDAGIVVVGHTHVPFMRQIGRLLLLNPGSVGLAFKESYADGSPTVLHEAQYLAMEDLNGLTFTFRRIPL